MLQTYEPPQQSSLLYNGASPSTTAPIARAVNSTMSRPILHPIVIVTGPAGSGKSTVAQYLAAKYGYTYIEGDDFHPTANIEKMAQGKALTDADRWDWLILLRDQALAALGKGAKGVVVTCSALKKKYRDVIRTARLYDTNPNTKVHFIYLRASKDLLFARVKARQGHYMKDSMVLSQLSALEPPDTDETDRLRDVSCVDVSGTMPEVQNLAAGVVDQLLTGNAGSGQPS